MTGWVVTTAAAAVLGAAGVGAGLGQGTVWTPDNDLRVWVSEPEQSLRIQYGSGSQIGVSIRDLGEEDVKGGKTATGVIVDEVEPDSPAQKAGFRAGDIIVEFDGERVRSMRQFIRLVQETPAGRQIQAAVTRDGQRVTLTVQPRAGGSFRYFENMKELVTLPKISPPVLKGDVLSRFQMFGTAGRIGIAVDDLSPQLAEYFGTKEGVLVTAVTDNSPAAKAGLKAGDVITSVNGGTVTSAADLRRRAQRLESGEEFTLAVVRDKKNVTLKGKLEPLPARRQSGRAIV
jgi:serine protease Do